MRYDVIVVGAGTGGTVAAETTSRLGLKTLLLERKPKDEIGNKVCGDGIEAYQFSDLNIPLPKRPVIQNTWGYIRIYAPNQTNYLRINVPGIIVDRRLFGQYLLRRALNSNVEFRDQIIVIQPLFHKNYVIGVEIKNKKSKTRERINAPLVIDASGFNSLLRNSMKSPYIDQTIEKQNIWNCYREIIETGGIDNKLDHVRVGFSQNRDPREQWWLFPKSQTSLNLGVCVWADTKLNPKICYQNYYRNIILPQLKPPIKVIQKGGGVEPISRPLLSLVENGIMFVGDAACCVNPISGAGIGSSMRTGKMAGEIAAQASEAGNYSIDQLWKYNRIFAKERAGGFTALHLVNIMFRKLSDVQLNYLIKNNMIQGDDLLRMTVGQSLLSNPLHFLQTILGGIDHPNLFAYLIYAFLIMRKIKSLYDAYPERSGFYRWKELIEKIYGLTNQLRVSTSLFKSKQLITLIKLYLKPV